MLKKNLEECAKHGNCYECNKIAYCLLLSNKAEYLEALNSLLLFPVHSLLALCVLGEGFATFSDVSLLSNPS